MNTINDADCLSGDITESEMECLFEWLVSIPLGKQDFHNERSFSDAVLIAEIIHNYHPRIINIRDYFEAYGLVQKEQNWNHLNTRVFPQIGFSLTKADIKKLCLPKRNCIYNFLLQLKTQLELDQNNKRFDRQKNNRRFEASRTKKSMSDYFKDTNEPLNTTAVKNFSCCSTNSLTTFRHSETKSRLREKSHVSFTFDFNEERIRILEERVNRLERIIDKNRK